MSAIQPKIKLKVGGIVFMAKDADGECPYEIERVHRDPDGHTDVNIKEIKANVSKTVKPTELRNATSQEARTHSKPKQVALPNARVTPSKDEPRGISDIPPIPPARADGESLEAIAKALPPIEQTSADAVAMQVRLGEHASKNAGSKGIKPDQQTPTVPAPSELPATKQSAIAFAKIEQEIKRLRETLPNEIQSRLERTILQRDRELQQIPRIHEEIGRIAGQFQRRTGAATTRLETASDTVSSILIALRTLDGAVSQAMDILDTNRRAAERQVEDARTEASTLRKHLTSVEDTERTLKQHLDEATRQKEVAFASEQKVRSEAEQQITLESEYLDQFWKGRETFYRELHAGICAESGANRKRLIRFRMQALEADTKLLESFGSELLLLNESLTFGPHHYDGADHRWYDTDDPIANGESATVFLPGWKLGKVKVKPCLSRQIVNE